LVILDISSNYFANYFAINALTQTKSKMGKVIIEVSFRKMGQAKKYNSTTTYYKAFIQNVFTFFLFGKTKTQHFVLDLFNSHRFYYSANRFIRNDVVYSPVIVNKVKIFDHHFVFRVYVLSLAAKAPFHHHTITCQVLLVSPFERG